MQMMYANMTTDNVTNISTFLIKDFVSDKELAVGAYYAIGVLLIFVMIVGFSTNFIVLFTFATIRKVRTTDTCLIMGLALSDIGQAILGIPFVVVSSFQRYWMFGFGVCQFYAFITTMLGIAQITTLTSIASERYFVIVHSTRKLSKTFTRCICVVGFSFVNGFLWATGPLLGWSKFKLEDSELACCVTWEAKGVVELSYTISICTIGWLIPLMIIVYAYTSISRMIYNKQEELIQIRSTSSIPPIRTRERRVTTTVLIMIGAFVMSWLPYSAFALWSAFGDYSKIPLGFEVAPAIFAKCSIIWNPIIYVARHKQFRNTVLKRVRDTSVWEIFKNCEVRMSNDTGGGST